MSDEQTPLHEQPFRMTIEHVFTIKGRGSVVVGKCISGAMRKGETVNIVSDDVIVLTTIVSGSVMVDPPLPHKIHSGLLLRGVTSEQVKPGMMLVAPETFDTED